MTQRDHDIISRDIKKSAAENRARLLERLDEIQYQEARNAGLRVFFVGIALVVIVAMIETYL